MTKTWWKESIIYQIYPRSFKDSNEDGIGDIQGIIQKLDYIKSLGIDVIWLCPVYKSPNDDNGYDISDYKAIMDEFGTMEDFDHLLDGIHSRGMKLVMDLVVNHSSDEHAWFMESRSSRDSSKRDYYIWRDAGPLGPPNNWKSFFGGDAWEYDKNTDQYYLHLFTKKQPDLNWENPALRQEVYDIMRYWFDKGIDGYRMDVISLISKREFTNSKFQGFNETMENVYANGPKIHEYLHEMNREVLQHYDILTVGEGPGISMQEGLKYVQEDREELNMIFHFDHMFIDHGPGGKFDPKPYDLVHFKEVFTEWDKVMNDGGWSSIFLGNHDFSRIVSRFGNDGTFWKESAKALSLLLLSLRGTPYIYQGDEIGMTNVSFEDIHDYKDVETLNAYKEAVENNLDLNKFMKGVHAQGRDNARTPVQWDDSDFGGFSKNKPWIAINPNYKEINISSQESNPDSILNFYRAMIKIRKDHKALVYGDIEVIDILNPRIFAYFRFEGDLRYLVLLNFSEESIPFNLGNGFDINEYDKLISNYKEYPAWESTFVELRPWEAILYKKSLVNV